MAHANHLAVRKASQTCFYTGLELDEASRSIEHILPQVSRKTHNYDVDQILNLVPCHSQINGAVGHAPLAVKFALKEFLASVVVFPNMTTDEKVAAYKKLAVHFLSAYRVNGNYPWAWKHHKFKAIVTKSSGKRKRAEMKRAYMDLLTEEEIKLGAYLK